MGVRKCRELEQALPCLKGCFLYDEGERESSMIAFNSPPSRSQIMDYWSITNKLPYFTIILWVEYLHMISKLLNQWCLAEHTHYKAKKITRAPNFLSETGAYS